MNRFERGTRFSADGVETKRRAIIDASFAMDRLRECRWCGEPVERRRLLGGLHVNRFYTCADQTEPPYTDVELAGPVSTSLAVRRWRNGAGSCLSTVR